MLSKVQNYFADTWEKARKVAEDPAYRTTDDENMGKGCRIKYNNRQSSSSESENKEREREIRIRIIKRNI